MSNFANVSDGFDETMANAFLLLIRDGISAFQLDWQHDALSFMLAQDDLAQFFDSPEFFAAVQVMSTPPNEFGLLPCFDQQAEPLYTVEHNGTATQYGLMLFGTMSSVDLVGIHAGEMYV